MRWEHRVFWSVFICGLLLGAINGYVIGLIQFRPSSTASGTTKIEKNRLYLYANGPNGDDWYPVVETDETRIHSFTPLVDVVLTVHDSGNATIQTHKGIAECILRDMKQNSTPRPSKKD